MHNVGQRHYWIDLIPKKVTQYIYTLFVRKGCHAEGAEANSTRMSD